MRVSLSAAEGFGSAWLGGGGICGPGACRIRRGRPRFRFKGGEIRDM